MRSRSLADVVVRQAFPEGLVKIAGRALQTGVPVGDTGRMSGNADGQGPRPSGRVEPAPDERELALPEAPAGALAPRRVGQERVHDSDPAQPPARSSGQRLARSGGEGAKVAVNTDLGSANPSSAGRRGGKGLFPLDLTRPGPGGALGHPVSSTAGAANAAVGESRPGTGRGAERAPSGTEEVSRGRPLGTRLLLAQGAVVAAGILTASAVAALMGPRIFHEHLVRAGVSAASPELVHAEEAFRDASFISLGVALVIALLCALVVTWYVTGRLQRPLAALTTAARQMGRGHYEVRAQTEDAGPELASLAEAFNTMAAQLGSTEDTRRRLLSDVAHEMRTPVATLSAYLDGLDDGVTEWTPDTSALFRANTDRLARLCEDIAMVSRAEEGRLNMTMVPMRVGGVLEAATRQAEGSYAAKGVLLRVRPGAGWDVSVNGDPERLGQVMSNLLSNAVRHTPSGGSVRVETTSGRETVNIIVSDTGEGLSAEQLPHVFERFYRADPARTRDDRGSGIGLTIAHAIVDAHGGTVTAASDGLGRGATFTVTLPTAPPTF